MVFKTRVVSKFLYLPQKLNDKWKWWQQVNILQEYRTYEDDEMYLVWGPEWFDKDWA